MSYNFECPICKGNDLMLEETTISKADFEETDCVNDPEFYSSETIDSRWVCGDCDWYWILDLEALIKRGWLTEVKE